jgi:transposase InsO family protein
MMAEALGIGPKSFERWIRRRERMERTGARRGRPEVVPSGARWKLRACYLAHYRQWGPSVLRCWAIREGLGRWSAGTIARVIADLMPALEEPAKPKRYEIAAPMVMWSEDATSFRDRGRKKELLVLQDECSRYKVNWALAPGPVGAAQVEAYLQEAFDKHGAPLVLKHDGDGIFHDQRVKDLLDRYDVVSLTSPPSYPPFNGKKERSMRDIKSFERALRKHRVGASLSQRIHMAMYDLNDQRPRPVLGGRIACERFAQDRMTLPNRKRFRREVETKQRELEAEAESRREVQAARRRAVIAVLSRYKLINWRGDVSTNSKRISGTS